MDYKYAPVAHETQDHEVQMDFTGGRTQELGLLFPVSYSQTSMELNTHILGAVLHHYSSPLKTGCTQSPELTAHNWFVPCGFLLPLAQLVGTGGTRPVEANPSTGVMATYLFA